MKEYRTGKKDVVLPYNWALGHTWSRFFDGLKEEKILGTRCRNCLKVLVPARGFCQGCYEDMEEWVEVGQEGGVETWCLVNYKYLGQVREPPYIIAQIRLDGADCGFTHIIGGLDLTRPGEVRSRIRRGVRVRAVWSQEKHGDINDIAFFQPL